MIGIYKITNKANNKKYIGQSNNVENRLKNGHLKPLLNNKHKNEHLQAAFNKYGIQNFLFEIIEECEEDLLNEREQYWIEYYKCYLPENGYNHIIGDFFKPLKLTNNDKLEIINVFKNDPYYDKGIIAKKYNVSCSTIYGILNEFDIKKPKKIITDEQKQKISKTLKGRKLSKEHYENVKKANQKSHGNTSTTEEQIKQVIDLLLDGKTNKEIEKLTGLSYGIIRSVRNKKAWLSLTKNIEFPKIKDEQLALNEKQAKEVIQLLLEGKSMRSISKLYNVSYTTIVNVKNKKTWQYLTEKIEFKK